MWLPDASASYGIQYVDHPSYSLSLKFVWLPDASASYGIQYVDLMSLSFDLLTLQLLNLWVQR